jgi:thiamine transport system ATP-binding protein
VLGVAGTTALVVTHDHDEAFTLADRVALMRAGRITQTGRPEEVWRAPADEQTARFLGCNTFLPATVEVGVADCALGEVELPAAPDGPVLLGLRPAALRSDHSGRLHGTVLARVHRRDHVRLLVRLAGRPGASLDGPVDAIAGIADAPEAGDPVLLSIDPDGIAVLSRL